MKLLVKISVLFLIISGIVFFIGGFISYQIIKREVELEQQYFLMERLDNIETMLARRPRSERFERDKLLIEPLETGQETEVVFSDTLVTHSTLERIEPHVRLDVTKNIEGRLYRISIYDLIVEEDDIADGVKESLLKIYGLLFSGVVIVSVLLSRQVLRPFNKTLQSIRDFNISQTEPIQLPKTSTSEFRKLNQYVSEMTQKMQADYTALKEFSENASHEMQTPLSVAKGKVELLLSEDLDDEQVRLLTETDVSLQKLSNLVTILSLLTKIENAEFSAVNSTNVSQHLNDSLEQFDELIILKEIRMEKKIDKDVTIDIDPTLLDILINNLIKNAIRHNINGGYINIRLTPEELVVENSGKPLDVPASQMFERFKKANQSSESLGLGLSLVKKITEISGLSIEYENTGEAHRMIVRL
jgi:signal transduction histidine kinase